MYKPTFHQRKAIRFRQFSRKGYALFACLGRTVTIGVLSVATLRSAAATTAGDITVAGIIAADSTHIVPDMEAALGDVEVTGSYAPLATGQAVRMVTVLTRDDIQAAPVHSINDLMKLLSAVDVRQRGPLGAQTDIGIRGSTQEQIAILLNGISIGDAQTGHNAMALPCDADDILRIEVLEGAASRVYGASSMAGAINIVTIGSNPTTANRHREASVRMEGGSYGYLSAAARASTSDGHQGWWSSLSGSYTRSDGYLRNKQGQLSSDYEGARAFWQGGYRGQAMTARWQAGVSSKGFGSNTFYSAKFDNQYEQLTKIYTAIGADTQTGSLRLRTSVYWNRSYDRFELIRGSEAQVPFNRHRTDAAGITLNSYFDWTAGRTALGAEFRNEDIVSTNLGQPLSEPSGHYKMGMNRSNLTLHLEHSLQLKRLSMSAGIVVVKNTWNSMPFTVYPGIDASLNMGKGWRLYASYNESLRMPSFTELYYSVGGHKADPYLKPEEMRVVEGGLKYASSQTTLTATVYHHHGRNMIDWVMDTRQTDPEWQSVNFTKLNTTGLELNASFALEQWIAALLPHSTLQLAYCYQYQQKDQPDYIQSQYALEYLRHKLTAQLNLPLTEELSLTLACRWQDRMGSYTTQQGTPADYQPYGLTDARLNWSKGHYTIYAELNNLTGKRYVDYGNVEQPGRWFTIGAKCHIGKF